MPVESATVRKRPKAGEGKNKKFESTTDNRALSKLESRVVPRELRNGSYWARRDADERYRVTSRHESASAAAPPVQRGRLHVHCCASCMGRLSIGKLLRQANATLLGNAALTT
ncbi:unnamed protein product [Leptosia nina]|uniref:Uncharacterized protein n=1 Tax=Leptosia nina TaxID=320188 RepID=A0AAV1JBZ6_9NEOP